jgi:hypothetical protein
MASTYSPLKIELITTGEQSATWGTTTNVNLGTAIEEAIVGSADVTFASANVTLTLTDTNGTQAARNLRLRLTGTTGGARNLIVPAIEKFYIVQNDTADTITIKNSTGTGVAIPTSMTALVYNDGTNIASASVYSTSVVTPLLAATDASFVNALPIASGGTGTTTTPTGTGAYVRATSPTLVTPALGTPSALVGTNITGTASGLTAGNVTTNANLTGAVTSVGNATSLGSFTSANLAAALTDETGTGANVFANSPTLVTPNLGTPSTLVGTNITGTAAGLSIGGNAATATTATTATNATNATTATNQSGGTVAATTGSFSSVATFSAGSAGAPAITTSGDTNTGVFFPAADTIAFGEGGTEVMRIDSSGNVGIGTTSPGLYRLRVNGGDVQISNTTDAVLLLAGGTANLSVTSTNADYATFVSGGNSLGVGITYGSGVCAFENSTGRVGIGTTTPSSTLQVVGTVTATTFVGALSGNATTASNAIGTGQTWQDLSGSRSSGSTYTNNTGRSIFISVKWDRDDGTLSLTVDGLEIGKTGTTAGPQFYTLTAIVPANSTYSVTASGGGGTLSWYELR